MATLNLDLDLYGNFMNSEHGMKLIEEIVKHNDAHVACVMTSWQHCNPETLDKFVDTFSEESEIPYKLNRNLEVLENAAKNNNITVETLEKLYNVCETSSKFNTVIINMACNSKLTEKLAQKLYYNIKRNNMSDVYVERFLKNLAQNENTPDDIILDLCENAVYDKVRKTAYETVIKRYKKLKENM